MSLKSNFLASSSAVRMIVGCLQGALLSLLSLATVYHVTIFSRPQVTLLLVKLLLALPGSFILVWGRMRHRSLATLLGAIVAVTLAITLHDFHQSMPDFPHLLRATFYQVLFELLLFIMIALGLGADQDASIWPSYQSLFENAWDLAILLVLCGLFVLLSWGILWLMAGLFTVIGYHDFASLLLKPWLWPIVSCVAFSAAVTFCLRGERLIAGVRRLTLALFGLLLPILSSLTALFLVLLVFAPLSRLWGTHHAGLLLSLAAVLLILLLNAVYQEGRVFPATMMRLSGRLAGIEILPLASLAIIALILRVHDHGWSAERVVAAGGFLILGVYAAGYCVAALSRGRWMQIIEPVNVGTAVLTVAIIVALLTPIADPARISVASQVARLRSGSISADRFDYAYLAHGSGRYGREALFALANQPPASGAATVRDHAMAALSDPRKPVGPPTPAELAIMITVHPAGAMLPAGLLTYATSAAHPGLWLSCLHSRGTRCDAVILPQTLDGKTHVAFLQDGIARVVLFAGSAAGWEWQGTLVIPPGCSQARAALLAGEASLGIVPHPALVLPSTRFSIEPPHDGAASCGS